LETQNGKELVTASIPNDLTPTDINPEQIETLLKHKTEGPQKLGIHPETGEPIYLLIGAYGPYVQLGETPEGKKKPKTASFPKGIQPEDITLDLAVGYLTLPRKLGEHPDTGKPIKASLGRFGPYVVHDQGKDGKDYRSLKKEDDVLTINLERALELLAEPKATRGRRGSNKTPLKELGLHPEDKEPVNIYQGPYGIYVKHLKTNVGLPEGETPETMTLEKALELLATKKSSSKKKKTSTKKKTTSAKKSSPKKTSKKI
jgi:DNA topoisomerase-1